MPTAHQGRNGVTPRAQTAKARSAIAERAGVAGRTADVPLAPLAGGQDRVEADRGVLFDMGVSTKINRAVLARYCKAYGRWVEAERKLRDGRR